MPDTEPEVRVEPAIDHEPPAIVRLGTLAELTLGGTSDPSDGTGGAGDVSNL